MHPQNQSRELQALQPTSRELSYSPWKYAEWITEGPIYVTRRMGEKCPKIKLGYLNIIPTLRRSTMKQLILLLGIALTWSALPAIAETTSRSSSSVTTEQFALGIRQPRSAPSLEGSVGLSKARAGSSGASAARDIGVGAAIGAVVGIAGGIIASNKKQSVEVDIGRTAYVLIGAASGAILGALVGLIVHSGR